MSPVGPQAPAGRGLRGPCGGQPHLRSTQRRPLRPRPRRPRPSLPRNSSFPVPINSRIAIFFSNTIRRFIFAHGIPDSGCVAYHGAVDDGALLALTALLRRLVGPRPARSSVRGDGSLWRRRRPCDLLCDWKPFESFSISCNFYFTRHFSICGINIIIPPSDM